MAHFKTPFSIKCTCGKIYSKNTQFDAGYSGNYIRIICRSCDTPIIFEAFDDFSRYDVMVGGAIRMSDLNWYHRALMKLQEEDADDKAAEVSKNAAKSIVDLQSAEESESSKEGDVEESAVEDEHDKQCKALVSSDQAAGFARTAAKSIADLQSAEESESSKEGDVEESAVEDEHDKQRKAAVHKLEKASEDTILGQIFFPMAHFKIPFSIQCSCGKIYSKNSQFNAGYSGNYIRIICGSCDSPIVFEAYDDFSRYDVMVGGAIRMSDLNWYHRALFKLQEEDADDKAAEVSKNAAKSIADLQSAEESESSKEGDVEESAVEDEHDKQCKALVSSDQAAEVARTAAKSIADLQSAEESESSKEGDVEESAVEDEHDKQRKAAVHKLEKASEDTILRQA